MKQLIYHLQDHDVFDLNPDGSRRLKFQGPRLHMITVTSSGERRPRRWKLKPGDALLVEIIDDVSYTVMVRRPDARNRTNL